MKLFNSLILIGSLAVSSNATTLKEMINSTLENNNNLKSEQIQSLSKQKIYKSVSNIYKPTVNVGVNYMKLDKDTRAVQVGATTTGFIKLGLDIYDGGASSSLKKQKEYEYKSSILDQTTNKKQTILNLVTLYFKAKTVNENINVFEEKSKTLKAQYDRIKTKYDISMATKDEVLKLQSEYETNQYTIEELKFQKEELLQNLSLITNSKITTIDNSTLPDINNINLRKSENIKSLEYTIKAQEENKNISSSVNKPKLKIENTLNYYKYNDYNERILTDLPEIQNQLMVSLTYNLYDTSSKNKIESLNLLKLSSKEKLQYAKNNEMMNFNISKKRLETQKLKLKSLKSAVEMGNSVYTIVKDKYDNGIVDNIAYLDALSKKTYNLALYKQALNDYEIAKANYFFASGIDFKEVLEKF